VKESCVKLSTKSPNLLERSEEKKAGLIFTKLLKMVLRPFLNSGAFTTQRQSKMSLDDFRDKEPVQNNLS
jgi:hypothetical protein